MTAPLSALLPSPRKPEADAATAVLCRDCAELGLQLSEATQALERGLCLAHLLPDVHVAQLRPARPAERAGQLVLAGLDLLDERIERHYRTGEQASCQPCQMRGLLRLGVTRAPGLRCCLGCLDRHARLNLVPQQGQAPHDPLACPLCRRLIAPPRPRRADPLPAGGQAAPVVWGGKPWQARWDQLTADKAAAEQDRKTWTALIAQIDMLLQGGSPALLRLAVALAVYRAGRSGYGRTSYVERIAALMTVVGNHESGAQSRPGKEFTALVWGCTPETVRASCRALEALEVPLRDGTTVRWTQPMVRTDADGSPRLVDHGKPGQPRYPVYLGGARPLADKLARKAGSNLRNEWTSINAVALSRIHPDLATRIHERDLLGASRSLLQELRDIASERALTAANAEADAVQELADMASTRDAELRRPAEQAARRVLGRLHSLRTFLSPPGGDQGEYVSSCLVVGYSPALKLIFRHCGTGSRPGGRADIGASRSPIRRGGTRRAGPPAGAYLLADQMRADKRFSWLRDTPRVQLAATVARFSEAWTIEDIHGWIMRGLAKLGYDKVRPDLTHPLSWLAKVLAPADPARPPRVSAAEKVAALDEAIARREAEAAGRRPGPAAPRQRSAAAEAELAKVRHRWTQRPGPTSPTHQRDARRTAPAVPVTAQVSSVDVEWPPVAQPPVPAERAETNSAVSRVFHGILREEGL
ncbi:hypothetical protein [Catellatospora sp. NPDC049133]|uniref:hypothetical protein n=1 Tax=Catellatospora sp. NPDC049133 TaxID=3155499 RepID=UPI0033ED7083